MWRFCGRNARNFTSIRKKNMVCRRVSDPPVFSESDLLDMVFFEFLSVWSFQKAVIQKRDFLPGADKDSHRTSVLLSTLVLSSAKRCRHSRLGGSYRNNAVVLNF